MNSMKRLEKCREDSQLIIFNRTKKWSDYTLRRKRRRAMVSRKIKLMTGLLKRMIKTVIW